MKRVAMAGLLAAVFAASAQDARVPVVVGQVKEIDACPSWGEVAGLQHSTLAVRSGPGTSYPQLDALQNGQGLYLCDSSTDGEWEGVVYMPGKNTPPDCAVSSSVPTQRAYAGPCRFGWVRSKWVKLTAG